MRLDESNKNALLEKTRKILKQNEGIEKNQRSTKEEPLKSRIKSPNIKKEEIQLDRHLGYRRKYLLEKHCALKLVILLVIIAVFFVLMLQIMPYKA